MRGLFYVFFLNVVLYLKCTVSEEHPPWRWICENDICVKTENPKIFDPNNPPLSLAACKMFCNDHGLGFLWPKPTGVMVLGKKFIPIDDKNINIEILRNGLSDDLSKEAGDRFKKIIALNIPKEMRPMYAGGKALHIYLDNRQPNIRKFSLMLQESYTLVVRGNSDGTPNVTIIANSFFGLRHGLETLSQLVVYNDIANQLLMVKEAQISDNPVYPYRGLLLDTSRNYIDVDCIKRTIDAMAAVKLNTFHWHITDSHSFPFVSERRPSLSRFGAYSPSKVYTKKTIQKIVQYALVRGVRVMPEFDAPAHVGEGWQNTNLTVCFNAQPWSSYCKEPPCGQLDPTKPELYTFLQDIYKDMDEAFQPDIFHMGGDEVSQTCWMGNQEILNYVKKNQWVAEKAAEGVQGFLALWHYFQTNAQERVYKAFGRKLPLVLWSSTISSHKHITKYLDKSQYFIQVWTTWNDPEIRGLLQQGYKLIISNYDALYLDCGFASWTSTGNNWCSPYIGWQKIYDNSLRKMAGQYKEQILGGEATLWSEMVDTPSVDYKLWPRAAALAERLWAEPETIWNQADQRMLQIRERLVRMGIQADTIQPEWCYHNENGCVTREKKVRRRKGK